MAEIDLIIAGRPYRVACRDGEEENLRNAARMVDAKSREALAGLGALSEARQLLFAALLLADQLVEKRQTDPSPAPDEGVAIQAETLALRLEQLADALERDASTS
jgi:cell division protein ZapA